MNDTVGCALNTTPRRGWERLRDPQEGWALRTAHCRQPGEIDGVTIGYYPAPPAGRLEELLKTLAASSEVTRAAQSKTDWRGHSRGLGLPAGSAQALLDELRQERD